MSGVALRTEDRGPFPIDIPESPATIRRVIIPPVRLPGILAPSATACPPHGHHQPLACMQVLRSTVGGAERERSNACNTPSRPHR